MKRLYTFAVIFGGSTEEIDVQARDEAEAWTKARAEAHDLYGDDLDAPPAYSLKMINPGGTGGLITSWTV